MGFASSLHTHRTIAAVAGMNGFSDSSTLTGPSVRNSARRLHVGGSRVPFCRIPVRKLAAVGRRPDPRCPGKRLRTKCAGHLFSAGSRKWFHETSERAWDRGAVPFQYSDTSNDGTSNGSSRMLRGACYVNMRATLEGTMAARFCAVSTRGSTEKWW